MFDLILAGILSWYAVGVLFSFALWSQLDNEESGWVVVWTLLALIIAHTNLDITLSQLAVAVPVYLLIGALWSFWRYKVLASEVLRDAHDRCKKFVDSDYEKYVSIMQDWAERVAPRTKVAMIAHHIFFWPVSLVCHMFADIIRGISKFIRKYMIGVYNSILNNELKKYDIKK